MKKIFIFLSFLFLVLSATYILYLVRKTFNNYEFESYNELYYKVPPVKNAQFKSLKSFNSDLFSIVDDKNLKNITVNFDSKSNKVRQVNLNYTYNPETIDGKIKSIIRIYNLREIIEINKRMMKKTSFFWSPDVYNFENTKYEEMYFPDDFFIHKSIVNYNIKGKFIDSIVNHKTKLYALKGIVELDINNDYKPDLLIESKNENSYMVTGFIEIDNNLFFLYYLDNDSIKKVSDLYKLINFK
ncbi:hypothetical protein [Empedobacter tilapiae]|uniref:hypothetical protein n=1 Tax=Empedobacter tilapiae TaxID=2491114 RepID=UPI0028D83F58|nr:hypothetical protein [Empedobacter tilapiae]